MWPLYFPVFVVLLWLKVLNKPNVDIKIKQKEGLKYILASFELILHNFYNEKITHGQTNGSDPSHLDAGRIRPARLVCGNLNNEMEDEVTIEEADQYF